VIWSQDNEFGIEFVEPLGEDEVRYLVSVPPENALHYVYGLRSE
jgi:hypothetical protein